MWKCSVDKQDLSNEYCKTHNFGKPFFSYLFRRFFFELVKNLSTSCHITGFQAYYHSNLGWNNWSFAVIRSTRQWTFRLKKYFIQLLKEKKIELKKKGN